MGNTSTSVAASRLAALNCARLASLTFQYTNRRSRMCTVMTPYSTSFQNVMASLHRQHDSMSVAGRCSEMAAVCSNNTPIARQRS